jgi:hypothetical protein
VNIIPERNNEIINKFCTDFFFGTEFNAEHEGVAQLQRREHSR